MKLTLRQALTRIRPGESTKVVPDEAYDQFENLKGIYPDGVTPSQTDLLAADFSNLDTIHFWDRYGKRAGKDYESIRAHIYKTMMQVGYETLTNEERIVVCRYHVIPTELQETLFDEETLIEMGEAFDFAATQARMARYERAKIILIRSIIKDDAQAIMKDILDAGLDRAYMEGGIRGMAFGDALSGLLDYINATPGSAYASEGMRARPYTPKANKGTLDDVCNRLIGIAMQDLT